MNAEDLVAIDIHTHAEEPCGVHPDDGYDAFKAGMSAYFGAPYDNPADDRRDRRLLPRAPDRLRDLSRRLRARDRVSTARHTCSTRRSPRLSGRRCLFHTGQTAVGAGLPGGMGMRLKYSNPIHLDDVAADFPDMPIICAHPAFPWQEEALSVATHKPNVYIDLSGWSPEYFPPILVKYANSLLKHKALFGSDWPAITPDRWPADFDKIEVKDEVRQLILKDNARRLLGL